MERIQQWIVGNTQKMIHYKDLKQQLASEFQRAKDIEDLISEEHTHLAQLQLRKEKLEIKKQALPRDDDEQIYQVNEEIQDLELEVKQIYESIESLEEKLDFVNLKITSVNTELVSLSPDQVDALDFSQIQSVEGARACLGAFFNSLLESNVKNKEMEKYASQMEGKLQEIQLQVEESAQQVMASERAFMQEMEQARQEYQEREKLLFKIIQEYGGPDIMSLMTNEKGAVHQNSEDLIQEYLRNKQNEST